MMVLVIRVSVTDLPTHPCSNLVAALLAICRQITFGIDARYVFFMISQIFYT